MGAPLTAGTIELSSGMAELRFTSGVLLALEAPARLELIDPMRCRLHWGTSLLDVPDSGKGFIVETTEGHAVDHGTRFVVMADHRGGSSEALLDPDLLMVKRDLDLQKTSDPRGTRRPSDRRSLIGFQLDGIRPARITGARLNLNLVPTGLGFASMLPKVSTFEVYGIRNNDALESWPTGKLSWDRAPGSKPA